MKELRAAALADLPRHETIDRILRDLPAKMAQAISTYLSAPNGSIGVLGLQGGHDGMYSFGISIHAADAPGSMTFSIRRRCEGHARRSALVIPSRRAAFLR